MMQSRLLWLLLLAAVSVDCGARTFKVLDTSTDLPIAGAEAKLIARGNVLWITHAEVTLREWHVKTDANGEFSISPPFAERAFLLSLWKRGYAQTSSVKEYKLRRSDNANQDVYYLTPAAEANAEYVRYLFYVAAEAMDTGKGLAGGPAIVGVPTLYKQAKSKVKTAREREELRAFCRFADDVKAQVAAGGPAMGTGQNLTSAQELVADCSVKLH